MLCGDGDGLVVVERSDFRGTNRGVNRFTMY